MSTLGLHFFPHFPLLFLQTLNPLYFRSGLELRALAAWQLQSMRLLVHGRLARLSVSVSGPAAMCLRCCTVQVG